MKAQAFMQRKGHILEIEVEILDETGLKKGGSLAFAVAHLKKLDWYEHEAVLLIVETVEIIGLVLGFTNEQAKRDSLWRQKVTIQKISIKENPIQGLSYDKKSEKTKVISPVDGQGLELTDVGIILTQANGGRKRMALLPGKETNAAIPKIDTSDTTMYKQIDQLIKILSKEDGSAAQGAVTLAMAMKEHLSREHALLITLSHQNQVQKDAITQLQNKYDEMNEDVKELVENYIPDLSAELTDES